MGVLSKPADLQVPNPNRERKLKKPVNIPQRAQQPGVKRSPTRRQPGVRAQQPMTAGATAASQPESLTGFAACKHPEVWSKDEVVIWLQLIPVANLDQSIKEKEKKMKAWNQVNGKVLCDLFKNRNLRNQLKKQG